jgi:hypothetical protein
MRKETIFSCVVDADPRFAYGAYHLARSLIEHCCDDPADIHVHFTGEVSNAIRSVFLDLGCSVHGIQRFGDGRCCNKIAQLENLEAYDFAHVVLLDTDTIALADLRPYVTKGALMGKVVDLPNPSVGALKEIAHRAGMRVLPSLVTVDAGNDQTYLGNCNGGFYSIPKSLCQLVAKEWRRWACWLLDNIEPLKREGKQAHVDQVAMWLAIHMAKIPYEAAPSNLNYYVHFTGEHRCLDPGFGIVLLHYHDFNVIGRIELRAGLNQIEHVAIAKANEQIARGYENITSWNFRYSQFPERGSGIGSRGVNLFYKRQLLCQEGAEEAQSVLDVGCGDIEVVKALDLHNYLGIDSSEVALEIARRARPEWAFRHFIRQKVATDIPAKQLVLCFEVLIHQPSEQDYLALIDFLAIHTERTLLVSGYDRDPRQLGLFFYEPLEESLRRTGKFRVIKKIGTHSDLVNIYRCDVELSTTNVARSASKPLAGQIPAHAGCSQQSRLPAFAYWHDLDHSAIRDMTAEWRSFFPEFQILSDNDIKPLIDRYFSKYGEVYSTIRLPAAKADIARLLALYEWGGLYVDCHCRVKDPEEIKSLIARLDELEAIFVDRILSYAPRPEGSHFLINSIIFARPRSQLLLMIAREALMNLQRQREIECEKGFVSYHVGRLTGPDLITAAVLQPGSDNREIRADFGGRVMIIPEETAPVVRNHHRAYSTPGSHWSERQRTEALFVDQLETPRANSADEVAALQARLGRLRYRAVDKAARIAGRVPLLPSVVRSMATAMIRLAR